MADEDPFVSAPSQQQPHIYRPIPRRNFNRNSDNSNSPDLFSDTPPLPPQSFPSQSQTTDQNDSVPRSPASSDFLSQLNARLLRTRNTSIGGSYDGANEGTGLRSNKSFMNLTSSTLFGIYDDVASGIPTSGPSEIQTPWGTGAETPAKGSFDIGLGMTALENGSSLESPFRGAYMKDFSRRRTVDMTEQNKKNKKSKSVQKQRRGLPLLAILLGKTLALFSFGVIYGAIVSLLHGTRELAAVSSRVGGVEREGWLYFVSWGVAGVLLGSLLPWVDGRWEGEPNSSQLSQEEETEKKDDSLTEQWSDIVRSVGAFVGIAFAIRKLPWQSTLQLTLTLALVNPALWYIIDRSRTGLTVSTIVTSVLTTFIFLANPDVLPSPGLPATVNSTHPLSASKQQPNVHKGLPQGARGGELFAGLVTYENLAVATWVGSVLFCSCVCFGSIGRRLAVLDEWSFRR